MNKCQLLERISEIAKTKPVYHFFEDSPFFSSSGSLPVGNAIWHGEETSHSLSFKFSNNASELAEIFGIHSSLFKERFEEAIHGSGSELNKIGILNSSSLASLLFFHNISTDNSLSMDLNGEEVVFDECHFEAKNKCIGAPSNMDVALFGRKGSRPVILFLESKFSEYLALEPCYYISTAYWLLYKNEYKEVLVNCGLNPTPEKKKGEDGSSKDVINIVGSHYCEGIKQMICHHIGVRNFITHDYHKDGIQHKFADYLDCTTKELANKQYDVYLGEILFRFDDTVDKNSQAFEDYNALYNSFVSSLPDSPVIMVKNLLTYQDVFKHYNGLSEEIKAYYKIGLESQQPSIV